ncbi:MAG TPA: hypothetical protein VK468_05025 [Pyrinomonadaceae bacterium]|nr:hypothetical protein [Pyrinomonadaceae bacterium]
MPYLAQDARNPAIWKRTPGTKTLTTSEKKLLEKRKQLEDSGLLKM